MLSIDVGSRKVSVVEGLYKNDIVTVNSFAEIEYNSEVTLNGVITDRSSLSLLINEIIKTNQMKSKEAIITFTSSDIIVREFKLPKVKMQQLESLVKNEMYRIVGSEDSFLVEFIIKSEIEDNLYLVEAYAISIDTVEGYFNLLRELKLKPIALDVNSNAASKLLSNTSINGYDPKDTTVIVADIGYSKITFDVFNSGVCYLNRIEVSPVAEFTREIASLLRVDITNEDLAKLDLSPNFVHENNMINDTCRYFIYRLSDEIQRYIQYVLLNSVSKTVDRICITGGITSIKGFDTAIANSLKIPVELLYSVGRLHISDEYPIIKVCNAAGALIRK